MECNAPIRPFLRPADLPLRPAPLPLRPGNRASRQPEQLKAQAVTLYAEDSSRAASSRLLGVPKVREEPSIPGLKKSVRPVSC